MGELRIYWKLIKMQFLAELQYRGWVVQMLFNLLIVVTDPIDAFLLLDRFGAVGAWQPTQIVLVYALAVSAFGFAELFFRGFDYFPLYVRTGELDRILLRPRSLALQVAASRFHLNRLARAATMLILASYCIRAQGAAFSPANILMLLLAISGGMFTYMGVFALTASLSIVAVGADSFSYVFTNGSYQVAKVPMQYLPAWLRRLFTYIIPMFPFCYYPAAAICAWGEPRWLGWLALPVGVCFLLGSLGVWRVALKKYSSTGS